MKKYFLVLLMFIFCQSSILFAANVPFPFEKGNKYGIKPNHVTQQQMNTAIINQYETWKSNYFKTYPAPNDDVGYIKGGVTGSVPWEWNGEWAPYRATWLAIHQHYNGTDPAKLDLNANPIKLVTASEHTGYGLLVFVLMAGYDINAQQNFDKIVNFYKLNMRTNKMMSWTAPNYHRSLPFIKDTHLPFTETVTYREGGQTITKTITVTKTNKILPLSSSASDGDMDIAYALLLADKQWGSTGTHNYKQLAIDMIENGITKELIHPQSNRILLGDWHLSSIKNGYGWTDPITGREIPFTQWDTRGSDFMLDNLRTFASIPEVSATAKSRLQAAISEIFSVMNTFDAYNSGTGLLPDFIVDNPAKPAQDYFLGEDFPTSKYSENSCRFPWRLALDYAHHGNTQTKAQLDKLANFISNSIVDPSGSYIWKNVVDTYSLNGAQDVDWDQTQENAGHAATPYHDHIGKKNNIDALHFIACFATSQVSDNKFQNSINDAWDYLHNKSAYGKTSEFLFDPTTQQYVPVAGAYFKDSLNLLSLLLISGNWWALNTNVLPDDKEPPTVPQNVISSNITDKSVTISWAASSDNVKVSHYDVYLNNQLKATSETTSVTINSLTPDTPYDCYVIAVDTSNNSSQQSLTNSFRTKPVVTPEDPNATGVPGSPALSKNVWNGEASYTITMNMWWGNNATSIILYENGIEVANKSLPANSPSAQKTTFDFTNKANGTYIYKCKMINRFGFTESSELTVRVTQGN